MIEIQGVRKNYDKRQALDSVNLDIPRGSCFGLVGPNGAGKSTLMKILVGVVEDYEGDVLVQGAPFKQNVTAIKRRIGYVPQDICLEETLTARDNLLFFGRLYGLKGSKLQERIQQVLALIGLADREKSLVRTFSGGMKRRLNIGCALLHDPDIIVLDEPTVGVDPQSRWAIFELIHDLKRQDKTILYSSHYMEEVEQLCNRVYIMDHGKVIASGTKSELLSILSSEDTIQVQLNKKSDVLLTEIKSFNHVYQVDETDEGLRIISRKGSNILSDLVHAAEKAGIQIVNYQVEIPSLEDVFLHLTGKTLRD